MAKCSCGNKNCKIKIRFDSSSKILSFIDKKGEENTMRLDANETIKLIKELKDYLIEMTEIKGG